MTGDRSARESDYWGHRLFTTDDCLDQYHSGLDRNTQYAMDCLEPLAGRRVLDFACGQGVTSCLLAARGAEVIGIDITPESIDTARELAERLGVSVDFICADLPTMEPLPAVDRVFGRYALHHVDPALVGSRLASMLVPDGWGAFVETTFTNPLLRFTRGHLVGRFGVANYGTADERPLDRRDFDDLGKIFGGLDDEVAELHFLHILDRSVLKYRWPSLSKVCRSTDRALQRHRQLHWLSYHHVLVVGREPVER